MKKKRTDLPATSEINRTDDDIQQQHQEEYDNKAKSLENNERPLNASSKMKSDKWDQTNSRLPKSEK